MNEAINCAITRMAVERGTSFDQMRGIIEEEIYTASFDSVLRDKMLAGFGNSKPSAEELKEEIARIIDGSYPDQRPGPRLCDLLLFMYI